MLRGPSINGIRNGGEDAMLKSISVRDPNGYSDLTDLTRSGNVVRHSRFDQGSWAVGPLIGGGGYGKVYKIVNGEQKETPYVLKTMTQTFKMMHNQFFERTGNAPAYKYRPVRHGYSEQENRNVYSIDLPTDVWVSKKLQIIPYSKFMDIHLDSRVLVTLNDESYDRMPSFQLLNDALPNERFEDDVAALKTIYIDAKYMSRLKHNDVVTFTYSVYMDNATMTLGKYIEPLRKITNPAYQHDALYWNDTVYPIMCEVAKQLLIVYDMYRLVYVDMKLENVMCNNSVNSVQIVDFGSFHELGADVFSDTYRLPVTWDSKQNRLWIRQMVQPATTLYNVWSLYVLYHRLVRPRNLMDINRTLFTNFQTNAQAVFNTIINDPLLHGIWARFHPGQDTHNRDVDLFMRRIIQSHGWNVRVWDKAYREANDAVGYYQRRFMREQPREPRRVLIKDISEATNMNHYTLDIDETKIRYFHSFETPVDYAGVVNYPVRWPRRRPDDARIADEETFYQYPSAELAPPRVPTVRLKKPPRKTRIGNDEEFSFQPSPPFETHTPNLKYRGIGHKESLDAWYDPADA
jgi:serine/threonine protein kinase